MVLGSSSRPLSSYGISDLVAKLCLTLVTPWTLPHQAPLSMEFSRQEYWSGLLLPSPGDFPYPGIEPSSPTSPALAGGFFTTEPPGKSNKLHKPFKFGCFWWNEKVVLADLYVPPNSNSLDSMTIVHLIRLECYKISKANPSS